ncbi:uncharacterized protein HMPREF1541_01945 [Cyphellophora europaea CBS 101466]|uniref:Major facilitator superfamily (MFS) profile domain-containing protein n=1 Tax=Cyphellophora europaea (strain CBS 101466) TaxID=1220924 RepID=W2S288_CYPE1|nr:uncharacterized protein HMPREF1541_01945 [Cyphellophora europaea CBS 101466]ETN42787.1 hypothetical protein HMPREF1541_01945 [Cyphellophora europaea CBS 101466]
MPTDHDAQDGVEKEEPPSLDDSSTEAAGCPPAEDKAIPPPDVGFRAYLQILGGFFLMFNTWGIVLTYGTFQSYYESSPASPLHASPSTTAWIGSLQAFLLLFGGGLCGRLFDAGYLRSLICCGTSLMVFGLMMASLARTYWHALLSQGLCVGLGMGCLLVPSVGTASTWFVRRRGLAVGIVTSGSAVGGVVLPIMCQRLLLRVGFGWTLRVLGFVALGTLSVSAIVMKQRLPPRRRGEVFAFRALGEAPFALYCAGMLVSMLGFYVFLQFVQSWAETTQVSSFSPIYYLPIVNAASVFGRTLPNLLSDHVGPLNVQIPCGLVSAVLIYGWLGVHSLGSLLTIAVLYGFFSGGLLALPPASVASLTPDLSHFGARMGKDYIRVET